MVFVRFMMCFCLGGAVSLAVPGVSRALEIVYPADKTWVNSSTHLVIKGGSAPRLEGMKVEVDGVLSDYLDLSSEAYRKAFGDMLIVEPVLEPGKNKLVVQGFVGGAVVATAKATVYYYPEPSALPPFGINRFIMHVPERETLCAPCHEMNPSPEALSETDPRKNPCAGCHKLLLKKKYVHGPAGALRCGYCHDPSSTPSKYRVRGSESKLCFECHQDKVEDFARIGNLHGPVAAGNCSACHDPHGSDFQGQMPAHTNDVCLGCHARIAKEIHVVRSVEGKAHPLKGVKDPVRPGRELTCAGCHSPHGSNAVFFFRDDAASRFVLCRRCHKK